MQILWQEVLTHALGFVLLVWVLRRFAWRPVFQLLDERRDRVAKEFQQIEQTKAQLETLQREYQARLARIEAEARAKIQEAIAEGRRVSAEIQEQAREQAAKTLAQTRVSIQLEIDKAKLELRDRVAQLALAATEKLLAQKLDQAKDEVLVLQFLDEAERSASKQG